MERIHMHEKTVTLITEAGMNKWMFEEKEDAEKLLELLTLSSQIENEIEKASL